MHEYKVIWGGRLENCNMDGFATIKGKNFEEAKNNFYHEQLQNGLKIGYCEEYSICYFEI